MPETLEVLAEPRTVTIYDMLSREPSTVQTTEQITGPDDLLAMAQKSHADAGLDPERVTMLHGQTITGGPSWVVLRYQDPTDNAISLMFVHA